MKKILLYNLLLVCFALLSFHADAQSKPEQKKSHPRSQNSYSPKTLFIERFLKYTAPDSSAKSERPATSELLHTAPAENNEFAAPANKPVVTMGGIE